MVYERHVCIHVYTTFWHKLCGVVFIKCLLVCNMLFQNVKQNLYNIMFLFKCTIATNSVHKWIL